MRTTGGGRLPPLLFGWARDPGRGERDLLPAGVVELEAPGVTDLLAMSLRICWAVWDSESKAASSSAASTVVSPVPPIVELEPPLAPVP